MVKAVNVHIYAAPDLRSVPVDGLLRLFRFQGHWLAFKIWKPDSICMPIFRKARQKVFGS
ncbi:MAG: hypothetical protein CSA52_01410 [Gammaproteobacteria bacterium]|nr:MAG: hypothetical protein CSA52_01410 [Gammaproteobacteria bacterium]